MIYFVQIRKDGPIKIGCTDNFWYRVKDLRRSYGVIVAIQKTMPGDRQTEAEMHRIFGCYRIGRTEQFRPGPELTEFLDLDHHARWESVEAADWKRRPNPQLNMPLSEDDKTLLRRLDRFHGSPSPGGGVKRLIRAYHAELIQKRPGIISNFLGSAY